MSTSTVSLPVVQPRPKIPMTLIEAIATEEGFYAPIGPAGPNRPQRNNNPADLEWKPWMKECMSLNGDPRFAVFPSVAWGFTALRKLLQFPLYKGKTISQAINTFAPGVENDTKTYVLRVCAWMEQTPDTVIDDLLG
jgi:hypothetical protein